MLGQGWGSRTLNGIIILTFLLGGGSALISFVVALFSGPTADTRQMVHADTRSALSGALFVAALIGLLFVFFTDDRARRLIDIGFLLCWVLLLVGGILFNLLPALVEISFYTRLWITNLLYGTGSLAFAALLIWKWRRTNHLGEPAPPR